MLAIVIPAYRPNFFQLALNSVASQTNKNFQCYIFDDAASEEIKHISNRFSNFSYRRFNENMGGQDLIGHWHRCLGAIKEEWVWLFSDDDIMQSNCVDEFYKTLNMYPNATLFRFSRELIDKNGQVIKKTLPIKNETGLEYLNSLLNTHDACLQDHVFNWKKLKEINGGFVNFPLAWGSDDATWCLLGETHKIIAIPSAVVQIRMSGINISSIKDSKTMKKKLYASMLFYLWSVKNFQLPLKYKLKHLRNLVRLNTDVPFLHFFQSPIFKSPTLILVIFLIPIRKLYVMSKKFIFSNNIKMNNRIGTNI